jgi:hypothetical protein
MYHHHIFKIVLSHPPPFCRVDLSSRCVFNGLLKEGAMDILSQSHLNTSVTSEISLIVRVILPSESTFPARVIGRMLTEGLIPFDIYLSTTPRNGYFRVAFKNENILRNFFLNIFHSQQPVVFDAQKFNPVQIQFCFESMPCGCCDEGLARCLISCFKNLGVHIKAIPETGIFHFQLPSTDSLFVAFVGLFQKIGSPISI